MEEKLYTYPAKVSYDKGDERYIIHVLDFDQYTETHFKECIRYMAADILELLLVSYIEDKLGDLPKPTYHSQDECGEGEEIIYISIPKEKIEKDIKEGTLNVTKEPDFDDPIYNEINSLYDSIYEDYDKIKELRKKL